MLRQMGVMQSTTIDLLQLLETNDKKTHNKARH